MYGLADANNFYVSVHRVFEPAMRHRPVIVMSDNDGCAIARSNEVKALGIPMGQAVFEIKETIRRHNIKLYSSQFTLYADMSNRVMEILSRYVPQIEVYSIDECFLNFRGMHVDLWPYGKEIIRYAQAATGIPVSLGIAPTKTLCKIANKFAKKYPGYEGCCVIDTEQKRIKALQLTDIGDVWGIGRQHRKRLQRVGVRTAYDFTRLPRAWVRKEMTVVGERMYRELHGEPCIEMALEPPPKKMIMSSKTYGKNVSEFPTVCASIADFSVRVARKLRENKRCAVKVGVFLLSNPHRTDLGEYGASYEIKLPFPTNSALEINKYAQSIARAIYKEGIVNYKKAGVFVSQVVPENQLQPNLFYAFDTEKHSRLMKVLDRLNGLERNKVMIGSQLLNHEWKISRNMLCPYYTTKVSDIIQAR